jgi:hypothetical protein
MKHYIITVPGWGTVYGTGTRRQAEEVARLRRKPGRGVATITEDESPDPRIDWKDLTELLAEMLGME